MLEFNMSLVDIDNMMPFERELYCHMIVKRLEEKAKKE